jgi:colanic acid/amylovoran biosynthesis glycosyltransferase
MRQRGRPHLLFSGRLHAIKGAHHLVPMALALQQAGVDFELSIAGDGPLRSDIEAQIHARGLQARVRCLGVLPFETGLMPLLRQDIDLFVCPHLQGDPSCTYIETLSGGVPIAGYDNEAWRGLWQRCKAGTISARNTPAGLARTVAALVHDTAALQALAQRAREFASHHLFEHEFATRVAHLRQTMERNGR